MKIKDPNQKFILEYDFTRHWTFLVELINVSKEESAKITYPSTTRTEGIAPPQYGTKSLLGDQFVDREEKYDLSAAAEGLAVKVKPNTDEDTPEKHLLLLLALGYYSMKKCGGRSITKPELFLSYSSDRKYGTVKHL